MASKTALKGRLAFFGGTFDPVHFGHLSLAIEIMEQKELAGVWFSPAVVSPFRQKVPPCVSAEHRLAMLKLALKPFPGFSPFSGELNLPTPSYTIDVVKHLLQQEESKDFVFLLGADALENLDKWKEAEELLRLVPCALGARMGLNIKNTIDKLALSADAKRCLFEGIVPTPTLDISASKIRDRLKKGRSCHHLVPAKVLDYIYENQLYS